MVQLHNVILHDAEHNELTCDRPGYAHQHEFQDDVVYAVEEDVTHIMTALRTAGLCDRRKNYRLTIEGDAIQARELDSSDRALRRVPVIQVLRRDLLPLLPAARAVVRKANDVWNHHRHSCPSGHRSPRMDRSRVSHLGLPRGTSSTSSGSPLSSTSRSRTSSRGSSESPSSRRGSPSSPRFVDDADDDDHSSHDGDRVSTEDDLDRQIEDLERQIEDLEREIRHMPNGRHPRHPGGMLNVDVTHTPRASRADARDCRTFDVQEEQPSNASDRYASTSHQPSPRTLYFTASNAPVYDADTDGLSTDDSNSDVTVGTAVDSFSDANVQNQQSEDDFAQAMAGINQAEAQSIAQQRRIAELSEALSVAQAELERQLAANNTSSQRATTVDVATQTEDPSDHAAFASALADSEAARANARLTIARTAQDLQAYQAMMNGLDVDASTSPTSSRLALPRELDLPDDDDRSSMGGDVDELELNVAPSPTHAGEDGTSSSPLAEDNARIDRMLAQLRATHAGGEAVLAAIRPAPTPTSDLTFTPPAMIVTADSPRNSRGTSPYFGNATLSPRGTEEPIILGDTYDGNDDDLLMTPHDTGTDSATGAPVAASGAENDSVGIANTFTVTGSAPLSPSNLPLVSTSFDFDMDASPEAVNQATADLGREFAADVARTQTQPVQADDDAGTFSGFPDFGRLASTIPSIDDRAAPANTGRHIESSGCGYMCDGCITCQLAERRETAEAARVANQRNAQAVGTPSRASLEAAATRTTRTTTASTTPPSSTSRRGSGSRTLRLIPRTRSTNQTAAASTASTATGTRSRASTAAVNFQWGPSAVQGLPMPQDASVPRAPSPSAAASAASTASSRNRTPAAVRRRVVRANAGPHTSRLTPSQIAWVKKKKGKKPNACA